ncbi:c-type cytochrome [Falsiroseomonas sp. HW251]|uniref:c-type cytochrome n=1 Tax=Falsiroseomonas sp. HW251 TaxID=3390998 RepID=UPI003D318B42
MRVVLACLILPFLAVAAAAQGDPATGRRLAEAQCASCHAVAGGGPSPNMAAPPFAAVARMPSTTALSLQAFLRTPHGQMPDVVLTPAQLDDVTAWILSLRTGPN